MILKVFVVLQLILIQVISAQISARDLVIQNVLNNLENIRLAGCSRSRRQINNPPANLPGTGNLPVQGFANGLSFKNDRSFGYLAQGNGSPNNLALNNGLPKSALNMGLPNSSPISSMIYSFSNTNKLMPQNRLLPNGNNNNNGLPINNIPNSLSSFNNLPNGLSSFNNGPNGLTPFNIIPNGLTGFDNIASRLPGDNNIPSRLPGVNNIPNGFSGLNNLPNGLPSFNNVPNGLPGFDNIPSGLPGVNNIPSGLSGFNNIPNGLPGFNNLPNGLLSFNNVPNGLPGLNNIPRGLPGVNNIPSGLPGFNNIPNGLPGYNNLSNGLPSFNNVPNGMPGLNNIPRGLPSVNNIPRAMPSFKGLPNHYNLPGTNTFQNLIIVPAGNNILNSNNLPIANSLPNINNNIPITNGLTSFSSSPCGIAYPVPLKNRMPINNLQSGNILTPINVKLPYLNNFRITEIGIGNGIVDVNRFPRNDQLDSNVLSNTNDLGNVNRLAHQGSNELTNINGFSVISHTPPVTEVSNNAQANNMFTSINNFPNINSVSNFAGKAENINTIQLNNDMGNVNNFQKYNMMPPNEQSFTTNIPFNNDFVAANHIPANTMVQNANSRLINVITNSIPLSNGGYLDDILLANNAVNTQNRNVQNSDGNVISSNDIQFGNIQVPVDNLHYETVETKLPNTQIVLPEGVHMFTNVPSEYQDGLMSNSLSLAKELVGNLQIEGLDNLPFLNGLPVAGITETVTVLNRK